MPTIKFLPGIVVELRPATGRDLIAADPKSILRISGRPYIVTNTKAS